MKKNRDTNFQYVPLGAIIAFPFAITVKILLAIGKVFHLSYNAVNIIVWYMLLPLAWAAILDYKLHKLILSMGLSCKDCCCAIKYFIKGQCLSYSALLHKDSA